VLRHRRRKHHKKNSFLSLLRWGKVNQKLKSKSGVDVDPPLPFEQAEEGAKNREPSARMFECAVSTSSAAALFLGSDEGTLIVF